MTDHNQQPRKIVRMEAVSGDALLDIAANGMQELTNAPHTGELFGVSLSDHDGRLSDSEQVSVEQAQIVGLYALLAEAYLNGRADQIADALGNNVPRTVRAKDLPGVLRAANIFCEPGDERTIKEELEVFASMRGALGQPAVRITSQDENTQRELDALLSSEDVEIQVLTPYELKVEAEALFVEERAQERSGDDGSKVAEDSADIEIGPKYKGLSMTPLRAAIQKMRWLFKGKGLSDDEIIERARQYKARKDRVLQVSMTLADRRR